MRLAHTHSLIPCLALPLMSQSDLVDINLAAAAHTPVGKVRRTSAVGCGRELTISLRSRQGWAGEAGQFKESVLVGNCRSHTLFTVGIPDRPSV